MSKAKDNFYRIKSICSMNVINYVDELESENAELISLLMNHDQHEDEEWKRDYENILNKHIVKSELETLVEEAEEMYNKQFRGTNDMKENVIKTLYETIQALKSTHPEFKKC